MHLLELVDAVLRDLEDAGCIEIGDCVGTGGHGDEVNDLKRYLILLMFLEP